MTRVFAILLLAGVVAIAPLTSVSAAPTVISHQGRILDGSGQAVSGVIPIKFTLFDSSSDGVEIWSETHPSVTVTDGLYSVILGSITPLSADMLAPPPSSGLPPSDRYLEIEVDGETISPRSQLVSSPFAITAENVSGDIQTAPGSLIVDYLDPDDDNDGISMSDSMDSTTFSLSELNDQGDGALFQYKVFQPGDAHYGSITFSRLNQGQLPDTTYDLVSKTDGTVEKFSYKQEFGQVRHDSRIGATDSSGFVGLSSSNGSDSSDAILASRVDRNILKTYFQTGSTPTETQFGSIRDTAFVELSHDGDASSLLGRITPTTSSLAIKTKGAGADANRVVITTNDSSAEVLIETDSSSITLRKSTAGLNQANMTAANSSNAVVDMGVEGETTTLLHSLDVDADGLVDIAIVGACTKDSAYESTTFSYPNASSPTSESGWAFRSRKSKTYQEMHDTEAASKTALELACDSSTASSVWSADDFSGLPATSLTIQASNDPLLNPIEHSSGAHLTPGGVWTNASDENLKENFRPVDCNTLLEQIESLEITEWNYKTESDEVRHIGPTAQEFQRVFGVGSDGKTISTIDPAGISLAAIKGLLEKNEQLEREVSELKTLVKKLIDSK